MPLNNDQQRLVEENMGLVGEVIKEKVHSVNNLGLFTYQDVFQIGCLGLIRAAQNYVPGKNRFSTYAYIAIRNEIFDALDYATVRRGREVIVDTDTVLSLKPVRDDFTDATLELEQLLDSAKSRASNMVAKGIDAIRLMAQGYSTREIGEMMGGVPAKNVTAWMSKARAFLKKNPDILAMREAV